MIIKCHHLVIVVFVFIIPIAISPALQRTACTLLTSAFLIALGDSGLKRKIWWNLEELCFQMLPQANR